ncbi:MAG: restriction endonuclease subunit S [Prevotellaceae bacterium]|jgi:type I restriction enzyme S subunit|nr:restriction endonuclease subunit S [Prevotellaceae bacterium]
MVVEKGYKQTEIGIIPEDWKIKNIEQSCSIKARIGWQGLTKSEYQKLGNYILITGTDFINGTINWNTCSFVSKERFEQDKNIQIKNGDILITKDGTIGKIAFLDKIPKAGTLNSGVFVIRSFKDDINQTFLAYIFKSKYFEEFLNKLTAGSTINHLYQKNFIYFNFPLPDYKEQTAIASVLSDIDKYILSLERLIAKKKAIKQGAMQNLLTGKIRLKGFKGEWVEKKLGEVGDVKMCKRIFKEQTANSGDIPFFKIGTFGGEPDAFISKEVYDDFLVKYNFPKKGDVLFSAAGTIGRTIVYDGNPAYYQDSNIVWIDNDEKIVLNVYLAHYFKVIKWATADGGIVSRLYNEYIRTTQIPIPLLPEQTAIATILSDMDTEIEALQSKLQKAKLAKQGVMQQLLTGKIRLVNTSLQSKKLSENRIIPIAAHIVGGHIVKELYGSKGWGRTKLQKSMHLVGYCCQLDFGNEYIRNIAGPDDQALMNYIDSKFKQYRHVRIEVKHDGRGGKHYNYIPTSMIAEIEQAFNSYPIETQDTINNLLNKIKKMDLARAEIVSTLYAVWNNRIIKRQSINDDLLLRDFYNWSEHKSDFSQDLVLRGLNYMRRGNIIPTGWGKYIDKK